MRWIIITCIVCSPCFGQITDEQRRGLQTGLAAQQNAFNKIEGSLRSEQKADISVGLKAVRWALRYNEFPKKDYVRQSQRVLKLVAARMQAVQEKTPDDFTKNSVRGYFSKLDNSVQPYAISFPAGFDPKSTKSLPLHLKLHGRANQMNEVNFFHRHQGKSAGKKQTWIQLDVYGRGNNAYRWAGEADVFEALADVKRRHYIDESRITLHGFSMGGAGAYHLGVHHPHLWSSAGAGAGFVDFYRYQNQKEHRASYQHATLGIYDAVDCAMNTFNVPFVAYGGEKDKQLLSGRMMKSAAAKNDIDLKLIIGPNMGHKFDPKSQAEFMAFHAKNSTKGRPKFGERRHIRFTTKTLKYNRCDWLSIEEMDKPYAAATVDAKIDDDGTLIVKTENVRALRLARGIASGVQLNGEELPFDTAADGLLPDVYYLCDKGAWSVIDYETSKAFPDNNEVHKRHDLQGPIDDAFMQSFVCLEPTGEPWSDSLNDWSKWTLKRFSTEWNKWHRGDLPTVRDTDLSKAMIASQNLILFGDPGSNKVIARIVKDLPLEWTRDSITFAGVNYATDDHSIAMIFPNPLNRKRYVVINSGHTFRERDFKASNSWLFPRLGDAAVLKFAGKGETGFTETVQHAIIFDSDWRVPKSK